VSRIDEYDSDSSEDFGGTGNKTPLTGLPKPLRVLSIISIPYKPFIISILLYHFTLVMSSLTNYFKDEFFAEAQPPLRKTERCKKKYTGVSPQILPTLCPHTCSKPGIICEKIR
jgi:hypothetical protein